MPSGPGGAPGGGGGAPGGGGPGGAPGGGGAPNDPIVDFYNRYNRNPYTDIMKMITDQIDQKHQQRKASTRSRRHNQSTTHNRWKRRSRNLEA